MVLSKEELIGQLTHEVNVLRHLITKIEPDMVDYRPTEKQRSTIELIRYLVVQGPALTQAVRSGSFDGAAWGAEQAKVNAADLAGLDAMLATHGEWFATEIGAMSEEDLRGTITLFSGPASRGNYIVSLILGNYIAYRTQLFVYLKLCGRTELTTANLWRGMDAPPKA